MAEESKCPEIQSSWLTTRLPKGLLLGVSGDLHYASRAPQVETNGERVRDLRSYLET